MDHHDDVSTSVQCLAVARLLISAVTEILLVQKHREIQLVCEFDGFIRACVIYEQYLIDDIARYLGDSFRQCPGGIVRRHYNNYLLAVEHLGKVRGDYT